MKIQKTEVFSATFQICASKSKHFTFPSHLIQQRSIWTNALNKLSCRKRHKPKLFSANCPENVTSILRFSWNLGDRLDQTQSTPLHDPTHWRKVNTVDEHRHQLN